MNKIFTLNLTYACTFASIFNFLNVVAVTLPSGINYFTDVEILGPVLFRTTVLNGLNSSNIYVFVKDPSKDSLEGEKSDVLETLEVLEENETDITNTNTNTKTKTIYENSSNTPENAENIEEEGSDLSGNEIIEDENTGTGSEESEYSEGSERPNPPNNTPENSYAGSVEEPREKGCLEEL